MKTILVTLLSLWFANSALADPSVTPSSISSEVTSAFNTPTHPPLNTQFSTLDCSEIYQSPGVRNGILKNGQAKFELHNKDVFIVNSANPTGTQYTFRDQGDGQLTPFTGR